MGKLNYQHVYLDTYQIQGYLWGKPDEKRITREIFRKLENSLENPLIKVKIPFPVMGELINNLIQDNPDNKDYILGKFLELRKKLKADLAPPPWQAYSIAIELHRKDDYIKNTDALIVSRALSDPYSSHLLTTDGDLLRSRIIKDIEKDMRKHVKRKQKLKITAEF